MKKYEEYFGINIISTNLNNSTDVDFLTEDIVNDVEKFHTSIDEYKKTPLVKLDNLASKLGVKNIFVKDESYRYGLNAFKGLGGLYAIFRIVCDKLNLDYKSTTFKDLQNKDIVNTIDGRNVGNIIDVKIDQLNGTILSLVVEPNKKMISFMNRGVEEEISWKNIERIGEDVILVRLE